MGPLRVILRCGLLLVFGHAALAPWLDGAITLTSPTDLSWSPIIYPATITDFVGDEQATSIEGDLVGKLGDPALNAFYTGLDGNNWGFRVRLGGDKEDDDTFSEVLYIGFAVNGIGDAAGSDLDFFLGVNTADGVLGAYAAGTGANTDPSSTTIESTPFWSTPLVDGNNLDWSPVNQIDSLVTEINLDGGTKRNSNNTDHFLTVIFPFNEAAASIGSFLGVPFNQTSSFSLVAAVARQANSLNQDIMGADGGTNSSTPWADLKAISSEINPSGTAIPEPAFFAWIIGLAAVGMVIVRRSR